MVNIHEYLIMSYVIVHFCVRTKPIGCMYGILFTYIYHMNEPNVGKYSSPMQGMRNDLSAVVTQQTKHPLTFSVLCRLLFGTELQLHGLSRPKVLDLCQFGTLILKPKYNP